MKTLFLFALVFLLSTSCRKEHACVCTHPGGEEVVFTVKNSRGNAESRCDDYYQENFAHVPWNETTCAIK
jgi:hypothetical protein